MDNLELGRLGEEVAVRYLESQGWTILGRNVRWGRREVDIIASHGSVLAFVEVKSRRAQRFGHPLEAITRAKRIGIASVARSWVRQRVLPPGTLVRFDAISVSWPTGTGSKGAGEGTWGAGAGGGGIREGSPDGVSPKVVHLPDAWRME